MSFKDKVCIQDVYLSLVHKGPIFCLPPDAECRHSAIPRGMQPLPAFRGSRSVRDSGFPCCKDLGLQASVPAFHGVVCLHSASGGRQKIGHSTTSDCQYAYLHYFDWIYGPNCMDLATIFGSKINKH